MFIKLNRNELYNSLKIGLNGLDPINIKSKKDIEIELTDDNLILEYTKADTYCIYFKEDGTVYHLGIGNYNFKEKESQKVNLELEKLFDKFLSVKTEDEFIELCNSNNCHYLSIILDLCERKDFGKFYEKEFVPLLSSKFKFIYYILYRTNFL